MSVQGLRRQALGNVDSPLTQTRNRPFEIRLVPTYLTGMAPRRCGSEAHSLRALARCREVAWPGNAFPGLMVGGGRGPRGPAGSLGCHGKGSLALDLTDCVVSFAFQTILLSDPAQSILWTRGTQRADSWAILQCILRTCASSNSQGHASDTHVHGLFL